MEMKVFQVVQIVLLFTATIITAASGQESYHREDNRECMQKCKESYQPRRCDERYRERKREQEEDEAAYGVKERVIEQEERESNHPYIFHEQSFKERVRTQHGRVRILPRFTERSEKLRGIDNYRLGIMEADPHAFFIPNHWDADAILFILAGEGTVVLLREEKKESINIRRGHLLYVPAGTSFFMINKHKNEKLTIAKLLKPVNTPGRYRAYFGAGGENPESFYRSFSREVLQAAFNTPWERLEKLFSGRKEGAIIRASEEKIKEIVQSTSGSEGRGSINLFDRQPSFFSFRGRFHEVDQSECEALREMDVVVSFANISSGSMVAPFYNSKATMLAMVVEGTGYFEMASAQLAGGDEKKTREQIGRRGERAQQEAETYEKIRSRLQPNAVYVVPAGHPVVTVASGDQNLQVLCFEVNARGNERNYVAGSNVIYGRLEREEAELSFGVPSREVEQILRVQKEQILLPAPRQAAAEEDAAVEAEGGGGRLAQPLDSGGRF